MGKEVVMSIKPEWVDKILSGEKTIEVRKSFKDDISLVHIYRSGSVKTGGNKVIASFIPKMTWAKTDYIPTRLKQT